MPPPECLRKVRETQGQRTKDFLGTLLNQNLEPNFGQSLCVIALIFSNWQVNIKASKPGSSQEKHNTTPDNIPITVRMIQAQKICRKQQMQKKVDMRSNWSDSNDETDSQTRGKPVIHDVSSDWETDTHQHTTVAPPLRRPNTLP